MLMPIFIKETYLMFYNYIKYTELFGHYVKNETEKVNIKKNICEVKHVASFSKVGRRGQTHPKSLDKQK